MEPELRLDALEVKTLKKDIEKSLRFWRDTQMLFKECINLEEVQIPEILNIEVRVKKKIAQNMITQNIFQEDYQANQ